MFIIVHREVGGYWEKRHDILQHMCGYVIMASVLGLIWANAHSFPGEGTRVSTILFLINSSLIAYVGTELYRQFKHARKVVAEAAAAAATAEDDEASERSEASAEGAVRKKKGHAEDDLRHGEDDGEEEAEMSGRQVGGAAISDGTFYQRRTQSGGLGDGVAADRGQPFPPRQWVAKVGGNAGASGNLPPSGGRGVGSPQWQEPQGPPRKMSSLEMQDLSSRRASLMDEVSSRSGVGVGGGGQGQQMARQYSAGPPAGQQGAQGTMASMPNGLGAVPGTPGSPPYQQQPPLQRQYSTGPPAGQQGAQGIMTSMPNMAGYGQAPAGGLPNPNSPVPNPNPLMASMGNVAAFVPHPGAFSPSQPPDRQY